MATEEPPESPVITTWKNALASFRKSIPKKDFEQIQQSTSPQDVVDYIESVQNREQGGNDAKTLRAIKACAHRLQRFSGALDMLAQGASRPGCLVWGSVKFALTIVSGSFEESERLLKAFALIGDCLPCVEIYNEIFLHSPTVQAHVHGMYVTILNFWARAIKFYKRRKLWRIVRSSWYDYDVEFGYLEATLRTHQDGMEKSATAQHMNDYHNDSVQNKEKLEAITTVNTALAHKEIVRWLAPIEYEAEYYTEDLEHARKLRHPGTCEWIRSQLGFQRWLESTVSSSESLLWIHAIPGAGKTILSSFLIDHVAPFGFRPSSTVFYFLFKSIDIDKNSMTAAARSLLYQLYKNRGSTDAALVEDIKKQLDDSGQIHAKSFRTIWSLFNEYAANVPGLVIVIDALDECIEPRLLIRGLQQLCKSSAVKVIVTSRREKELVQDLRDWMPIGMGVKEITADIAVFLAYKISRSPKLSDPRVCSSVFNALQSRSNGMFLWVALMIKDLKSKSSVYEIQDALLALPEGLDNMYERILRRLDSSLRSSTKKLCLRVLRWVVCATRPLQLKELEEALKLEYGADRPRSDFDFDNDLLHTERDIELACGSLLTVRSGTVQLIHLSAGEFLQNQSIRLNIDDSLRQYLVDVPSVSAHIASHCASYLLSQCAPPEVLPARDIRTAKADLDVLKHRLPLLEYACFNWLKHLISSAEVPLDRYGSVIQSFFESYRCLVWVQSCFNLDPDCSFRLHTDVRDLLDWAKSHSDGSGPSKSARPTLIQVAVEWAGSFQSFLVEYEDALKCGPFEAYFVDPERIFGSSRNLFCKDQAAVSYEHERHIVLDDAESGSEAAPISEIHQLPRYSSKNDDLGFFCLDPIRGVFFFVDQYPRTALRIFVQECSTGRRLPPLTVPKLDDVEGGLHFLGACMSNDKHHLAISLQYKRESRYHCYTAIWAIAKKLNFEVGHRTSTWARKLSSSTMEPEIFPFSRSIRPVAFADDGSLCCCVGQINISTGEVRPLPAELPTGYHVGGFSYSEDGKTLLWRDDDASDNRGIQLYSFGNKQSRSFPFSAFKGSIKYYTSGCNNCEFAIYLSHLYGHARTILLDLREGTSNDLDIPPVSNPIDRRFSFTFYGKDRLLGLIDYGENPFRQTRIFVWTGIPRNPYLWATRELGNQVHGDVFDKESSLLYVVYPGRIWARISLESSALVDMDLHVASHTQSQPIRVESCLSRNGKKLAVLKCWKARACVRVLDLDRPGQTLLCSWLDMPTDDIGTVNILFSPDVELLLVYDSLYRLDCSDEVDVLIPIPMPSLFRLHEGQMPPRTCVFSSSHDYVAVASATMYDDDQPPIIHVYHVPADDGQIAELDISVGYLETLTGFKIVGIRLDVHPSQLKLGVACRVEVAAHEYHIKFLMLNLRSLDLELVQPSSHERIPLVDAGNFHYFNLAHFSSCGHYFMLEDEHERHVFPQNRTDLELPCKKPLTLNSNLWTGINCFFSIDFYNGEKGSLLAGISCELLVKWHKNIEYQLLTTFPAHLRYANFTLLLGEEEDSNLRFVFHGGYNPPEIKYLNFTWNDLLSGSELDFSTRFYTLPD